MKPESTQCEESPMGSPWKEVDQHVDRGHHGLCQSIKADISTCSETIPSALKCRTVGGAGNLGSIISEVYCERRRPVVGIACAAEMDCRGYNFSD